MTEPTRLIPLQEHVPADRIEALLTMAEGLQRQIEDLQGLRDTVLTPVYRVLAGYQPGDYSELHHKRFVDVNAARRHKPLPLDIL